MFFFWFFFENQDFSLDDRGMKFTYGVLSGKSSERREKKKDEFAVNFILNFIIEKKYSLGV